MGKVNDMLWFLLQIWHCHQRFVYISTAPLFWSLTITHQENKMSMIFTRAPFILNKLIKKIVCAGIFLLPPVISATSTYNWYFSIVPGSWNFIIKFGGPTMIFFFPMCDFKLCEHSTMFHIFTMFGLKSCEYLVTFGALNGTWWPLELWIPHTQNISTWHY